MSDPEVGELLLLTTAVVVFLLIDRHLWRRSADFASDTPPGEFAGDAICPCCCRPSTTSRNFCRFCFTPLTTYASTGPIESILAQGEMFRRSVSNPSRIAVVGLWLLVIPVAGPILVSLLAERLVGETTFVLGLLALYIAIAVKATGAYLGHRHGVARLRPSPLA